MKFDPFQWEEVKTNEKISVKKGWLRLRISAPAAVYIEAEGYEALAGYAASLDVDLSEAASVRIEAAKGARAFLFTPPVTSQLAEGEVFTNIDRMRHESGAIAEVTKAMRLFEIERRSILRDMRIEAAKLKAASKPPAPAAEEKKPVTDKDDKQVQAPEKDAKDSDK